MSTHSNAFNVIMIGPYETPLFAKNGWLTNLTSTYINSDPSYDASDLLPPVAKALSYKNDLYAVPFYGESSMLYYRTDLFKAAGLTMPAHPTWAQVQAFAAKLNVPGKQSGICLRGLAGWGDNMAALDTVVNTLGGEWFNMAWSPQLTSPAFEAATNFYVNLVRQYGEPGASSDSFNQLLTLYGQGKCAMWYDATVAATSIATSFPSMAATTGYAFAPVDKTTSSGWLWSWALASRRAPPIPAPRGSSCPGLRPGRPADRGGDRGHRIGQPGADHLPIRRLPVHPGRTIGRLGTPGEPGLSGRPGSPGFDSWWCIVRRTSQWP